MSPKVSEAYKQEKKEKLIHAAKRVFIQKGYTHTTMQDIMDEAGVSRGALYTYFDNIEHAFLEVLQSDDQQEIVFFKPNQSSSLWSQLTNWVQGQQNHIETIQQSLLLARAEFFLSTHSMGNKERVPNLIERYHRIQEAIQEFIQRGIKQGEFQPQLPPQSISLYLISFLDGLMLDTFQLGSERTDVEEQLHVLLFSLKQMLCPIEKKTEGVFFMLFHSSRIMFRKMTPDDAELYHTWRNDLEVMQSTQPYLDIHSFQATRDFVDEVILGSPSSKSYLILEKQSQTPIGITSLIHIDPKNRNAECIIDLGEKRYWGKGYGREAMQLLLDYAFLEMNLHRVSLRVFSFNKRAINLYEKLGFQYEGSSRQALFRNGKWHDIIQMGILQQEYIRKQEN